MSISIGIIFVTGDFNITKMEDQMGKKYIVILMIFLGILGSIIFFPVNIKDQYTCLFHMLSDGRLLSMKTGFFQSKEMIHQSRLDMYLNRFAYIWWGSLILFTYSVVVLRKIDKNILKKSSQ